MKDAVMDYSIDSLDTETDFEDLNDDAIETVQAMGDPNHPSHKTLIDFSLRLSKKDTATPKKAETMIKVYKSTKKQKRT